MEKKPSRCNECGGECEFTHNNKRETCLICENYIAVERGDDWKCRIGAQDHLIDNLDISQIKQERINSKKNKYVSKKTPYKKNKQLI